MKGRVDLLHPYHQGNGSYYILFEGSESDPSFWTIIGDNPKLKDILIKAAEGAVNVFLTIIPEHTYFLFRLAVIRQELKERVKRIIYSTPSLQAVSLSTLYSGNGWNSIDINRMIDSNDKIMAEAGPRPGSPPLKVQIARLHRSIGDRQIVLVDDVCFKGQTSKTLIQQGLKVVSIVGGVVTDSATTSLTKRRLVARDLEGVITSVSYQKALKLHPLLTVGQKDDSNGSFVDTCPLHDFIPFAPYCGLTLGVQTAQFGPMPLIHGGMSFSRPYLLPYLDAATFEAKSSVPAANAEEFSALMIANAIYMFEKFNDMLGCQLTPRMLAQNNLNCSYPLARGKSLWEVDIDEPVTLILKGDYESIGRN